MENRLLSFTHLNYAKAFRALTGLPVLATGLYALSISPLQGIVLIQVDVSDPSAVVFTATGNAPLTFSNQTPLFSGVTLFDFFPAGDGEPFGDIFVGRSTLGPANDSEDFLPYNFLVDGGFGELRLVYEGDQDEANQVFDTTAPAFSGSLIVNLEGLALPAVGTIGPIAVFPPFGGDFPPPEGDFPLFPQPELLGEWQVIPEPRVYAALFGLISLLWVLVRRRRP